jgi:hypothetical protein
MMVSGQCCAPQQIVKGKFHDRTLMSHTSAGELVTITEALWGKNIKRELIITIV